jgi:hypothetical protein
VLGGVTLHIINGSAFGKSVIVVLAQELLSEVFHCAGVELTQLSTVVQNAPARYTVLKDACQRESGIIARDCALFGVIVITIRIPQ